MVVDSIVKRLTALASEIKGDRAFRPHIVGYQGGFPGLLKTGTIFAVSLVIS